MIKISDMRRSTKAIGVYEEPIIETVVKYFSQQGYEAVPHARFNIAWGSGLSDLDILLAKGNSLTLVEVKSKRDKISRAKNQIMGISDYIDYAYVATDKLPKVWSDPRIGLLFIEDSSVACVREAKKFTGRPKVRSLFALRKKCLLRFLGDEHNNHLLKYDLAIKASLIGDDSSLRQCLKEIVTCSEFSETDCPIWRFTERNVPKTLPMLPLESSF